MTVSKTIQEIESGVLELAGKVLEDAKTITDKDVRLDAFKAVSGFCVAYLKAKGKSLDDDADKLPTMGSFRQKLEAASGKAN